MASSTAPAPRPAYASLVLSILFFVYVLNFLDRQLLSILAKPVQDELGITDGQLGLLGGLYFALFYCVLGVPVAWLADRGNRVRILALACALWSAATIACGLARSYPQLAAARMAVGIGEAGGVPPSYSIISDYFPPHRRGIALALYNLGPPIGSALGVAFGAAIAAAYDWRLAFILLGIAGLAAAAITWIVVREPRRGATDAPVEVTEDAPPPAFWPALRLFFANPALRLVALAGGATQFVTYATLNFTTLFLMREKGMALSEIAVWYALLLGVVVSGGTYVSGWLIDRFSARRPEAYGLVPGIALILAVPCFVGFVSAPSWPVAMLFLAGSTCLNCFYLTPSVTLVQNMVPAQRRTISGAVLLLVMNLIGLGLGPTYLGAMSDWLRAGHPDNPLQMAFYSLIPFYALAAGLYLALARTLARTKGAQS
ncbi:spinster family MFS transporter [Sphingopyxis panaciterrae]